MNSASLAEYTTITCARKTWGLGFSVLGVKGFAGFQGLECMS